MRMDKEDKELEEEENKEKEILKTIQKQEWDLLEKFMEFLVLSC